MDLTSEALAARPGAIQSTPAAALTAAKDEAMKDWCDRISQATGAMWRYVRVNLPEFDTLKPNLLNDLLAGI
jgi:hypothetical protein